MGHDPVRSAIAFSVLVASIGSSILIGQTTANPSATNTSTTDLKYVPTLTFDVMSVRENKVDANAGMTMSGQFAQHSGTLHLINWDIENLIGYAYGVDRYQLAGAPHWPRPTVFVVDAKGSSEADSVMANLPDSQQRLEHQHMLQVLLVDRFNLRTHWETREGDVYDLVPKHPLLAAEGSMAPTEKELRESEHRPLPAIYQRNDGDGYDFIAHRASMTNLAEILRSQFGRPVVDKTGLTGRYDFVLKYKGRWDRDREASDMDPLPPLDRALQVQLGLKLEPAKGQVRMLVIEHIDKPSAN